MTHRASPAFWKSYRVLPESTHFRKVGRYWSARVGLHDRVIGVDVADGVLWFWIGCHADYDVLIG